MRIAGHRLYKDTVGVATLLPRRDPNLAQAICWTPRQSTRRIRPQGDGFRHRRGRTKDRVGRARQADGGGRTPQNTPRSTDVRVDVGGPSSAAVHPQMYCERISPLDVNVVESGLSILTIYPASVGILIGAIAPEDVCHNVSALRVIPVGGDMCILVHVETLVVGTRRHVSRSCRNVRSGCTRRLYG